MVTMSGCHQYMYSDVDPEVAQSLKMWRKSIMLVWQHASQHKCV